MDVKAKALKALKDLDMSFGTTFKSKLVFPDDYMRRFWIVKPYVRKLRNGRTCLVRGYYRFAKP